MGFDALGMGITVSKTIENENGIDEFSQSMELWQFWWWDSAKT